MKSSKSKELKKNITNVERRCMINICKYYNLKSAEIKKIIKKFLNK